MFKSFKSKAGKHLISTFKVECGDCLKSLNTQTDIVLSCPLYKTRRRRGHSTSSNGSISICTDDIAHINSTRLVKEKLKVHIDVLKEIEEAKETITEDINQETKRLIHNLTSINAHNIQELYALVPQELLTQNLKEQIANIKSYISKDPEEAAQTFLRIAKNNAALKTEFSVFKKLYENEPNILLRRHPIKRVVLNIFHIFFQDFTDNGVFVKIDECTDYIEIDYELVQVALYHLIENATKYILPQSTLHVRFISNKDVYKIELEMISIQIFDSELEAIKEEGVSGLNAIKLNRHGNGIGLDRVVRILPLNNARLNIRNNIEKTYHKFYNGVRYEKNVFEIEFKLKK